MLDVKKTVVGELEYCYSLAMLHYKGKDHFLLCSRTIGSVLFDLA